MRRRRANFNYTSKVKGVLDRGLPTSNIYHKRDYHHQYSQSMYNRFYGLNTVGEGNYDSATYLTNTRMAKFSRNDGAIDGLFSRYGKKLLAVYGEEKVNKSVGSDKCSEGKPISLKSGKPITFELGGLNYGDTITALTFEFKLVKELDALIIVSILETNDSNCPLSSDSKKIAFKTCELSTREFREKLGRFILGYKVKRDGKLRLKMELYDEPYDYNRRTGGTIESEVLVRSVASGEHMALIGGLGRRQKENLISKSLEELNANVGRPSVVITKNNVKPVEGMFRAYSKYEDVLIFPMRENNRTYLYRFFKSRGVIERLNNVRVSPDAKFVRMVQGGEYVYYVDGLSDYQRFKLDEKEEEWRSEVVSWTLDPVNEKVVMSDVPAGASLITMVNNRIYLAGWESDPTRVMSSYISGTDGVEGAKERFCCYPEAQTFHSPNKQTGRWKSSRITALITFNNELHIYREDGATRYISPNGLFGKSSASDSWADNIGVKSPRDVAVYNGAELFFNESEGWRRSYGGNASFIGSDIANWIDRYGKSESRFIKASRRVARYFYDRDGDGIIDSSLLFLQNVNYQTSPWYLDDNTPAIDMLTINDEDYCLHSQYACVFINEAKGELFDFNSPIIVRRAFHRLRGNPRDMIISGVGIEAKGDVTLNVGIESMANSEWKPESTHWFKMRFNKESKVITRDARHRDNSAVRLSFWCIPWREQINIITAYMELAYTDRR